MPTSRNIDTDLVNVILGVYDELPSSERAVADFILNNRESVTELTAGEIARRSNTSSASMSRFVRSIGFSDFGHFRFALARMCHSSHGSVVSASTEVSMDDIAGSIRFLLKRRVAELENTIELLGTEKVERAIRIIQVAGTIGFAGVGNTISVAQAAAFKFEQVGYRGVASSTPEGARLLSGLLTSDDCIIALSSSGLSYRLLPILENAIDTKTPVIIITDNAESELAHRADIVLQMAAHDRLLADDLSFSHSSMEFIIDTLVLLLLHDARKVSKHFE